MLENETIGEFNVRVHDIANNFFTLSEKISDEKIVRKVLLCPRVLT